MSKIYVVAQPNLILKVRNEDGKLVPTKMAKGTEYEAEEKNVKHLVKRGKLVLAKAPKKAKR